MQVEKPHPIETFDSLLRDLVSWGLVERQDTDTETRTPWQLVPDAQHRLDELLSRARVPGAEADFYLDHLCADCHQRGLTKHHGGSYLCETCWTERQARLEAVGAEPSPSVKQTHFWHRSRPGQATTLAS
ncbi:MAG: hypothetical protein ABSB99_09675 [Acidimicrobiales bacterium]|jgi:hypothetical protein